MDREAAVINPGPRHFLRASFPFFFLQENRLKSTKNINE